MPISRLPTNGAVKRTLALSVEKLVERTAKSAEEAREYNKTISTEDQETFYLAGMNAIAERIWQLARKKNSDPEELRIYLDLFLRHREQKIKEQKTKVMLRHLELLETKRKALEELSKDPRLSDAEYFAKAREILSPINNGADRQRRSERPNRTGYNGKPTQEIRTIQLLENGLAP